VSEEAVLEPGVVAGWLTTAAFENRFLLVTVASRRVLQIRGGSRPRADVASHKPVVQAVAEVLAGCVPYSMS
jgi:DNA-directed RNA polymerase subunit K/omega